MILQSLAKHYESLVSDGKISPLGWGELGISYAICIDDSGQLKHVICVKTEQIRGKKTVLTPQIMNVPAPAIKTANIAASFLTGNSAYILGMDNKGKKERAKKCFEASKELHEKLLESSNFSSAKAVKAFFQKWNPDNASENEILKDYYEDIVSGVNLVFIYDGLYIHEYEEMRKIWQNYYDSPKEGGEEMPCLITGKKTIVEPTHPLIKGVAGAQTSGAALVSFNAPAFCSYGKEQNYNAPVSKSAAFAYTTTLNKLLSDREHVLRIGDATVVMWTEENSDNYVDLLSSYTFGAKSNYPQNYIFEKAKNICNGKSVSFNETNLEPDMDFYILGLSPNAARLSVRFFLKNTFGNFIINVTKHYERLEIIKDGNNGFDYIPIWRLINETVNPKSQKKSPSEQMSGDTLTAVLNNTRYPATLLNGLTLRIRADKVINRERAAAIKAYYLKNKNKDVPEEVLTVSLNKYSRNVPYNLGRLFSVLEAIQNTANPGLNSTIRDRYFNSASATPAVVFPVLINLAQKHLAKIRKSNSNLCIFFDKQIDEIMDKLDDVYPSRLNLPQQGTFQLGYYHQKQERFNKKEEN